MHNHTESLTQKFVFYFDDGRKEILVGKTAKDAFFGVHKLSDLQSVKLYTTGVTDRYRWDPTSNEWKKTHKVQPITQAA